MISLKEIHQNFSELIDKIDIRSADSFGKIEPLHSATEDAMVFANNEKFLLNALQSKAKVVVTNSKLEDKCKDSSQSFVFAKIPDLLITKILQKYFYEKKIKQVVPGIDSSASISSSAVVSDSAYVGKNVVLGESVVIGENCYIGSNVVIEDKVKIGKNTEIHSQNFIGSQTEIGENCIIRSSSSIGVKSFMSFGSGQDDGKVVLKDFVEIGTQCSIDRPTTGETYIGESSKLDNLVKIAEGCHLDNFCLITAGVQIGHNARLGKYFTVGGNSFVEPNTVVADQVLCGGMTYVDRDINEKGQYGGIPVQKMKDYLRTMSTLAHLPKFRKALSKND